MSIYYSEIECEYGPIQNTAYLSDNLSLNG